MTRKAIMKNLYITPKILLKKTKQWEKELLIFRNKHKNFIFKPEKSALLILDMQKFFLEKKSHAYVPSAKYIVPNIKALIKYYHFNELPVIITKHAIINKCELGIMDKWWSDIISDDDKYSEIIEELHSENNIVLRKTKYSAFLNTNLNKVLKENGVEQLVICGIFTHLCCETTARDAFMRDYEVYFTIDGTATYNEKFHKASLLNLSHGFVIPVTTKEIADAFVHMK